VNRNQGSDERGMALPAVIFTLAIMAVLAVVAFRTADDERRSSWATKESGVALYAAEAGLRTTLGTWPTAPEAALAPGDSLDLGWQLLPNRSSYRAKIHRVDRGGLQQFAVVVEARSPGLQGGRSRIVGMVSAVPIFKWGIYSEGNVVMSGGSYTDGYNSNNGPYNPLAVDSIGSIATNGNISMSGGGTVIKGDATAQGTVSGGTVTGTNTPGAPPFPAQPIVPCPAGYTPAANVPSGAGISYNSGTGVLSVSGGKVITLNPPPTVFYFSSVTLSGGSQLIAGGAVQIMIGNQLNLSGGTLVNPSGVPSNLAISSCGSGSTTGWTLSGGSGAAFTVYAPNHPITVTGSGDIFGAIVGASYTASGGSKVHFDEALLNTPTTQRMALVGSWVQTGN
jgi:hypothetical protein